MRVGVPREIKRDETRVAITPDGVHAFALRGHSVVVEKHAGVRAGIDDADFAGSGATIVPTAADVFGEADLVLKVKEPLEPEYGLLRENQVLFTYLHLAANRTLTDALRASGAVCIGYETVQNDDGALPLLIPMSEVAGRLAVQAGAWCLERVHGGRGVLLGGVTGVPPANVVVLGAGTVGSNAARIAVGMGASVSVVDRNLDRLRYMADTIPGRLVTIASSPASVERAVQGADLVIGAVLVPGASAPCLVTPQAVLGMKPGAAIVDVAIDQGGCVATMRPTRHSDPVFVEHGVVHYGVTNMPAAVPRTSTLALTSATLPFALSLADLGWREAASRSPALARGVQVVGGALTHPAVAQSFNIEWTPLDTVLDHRS